MALYLTKNRLQTIVDKHYNQPLHVLLSYKRCAKALLILLVFRQTTAVGETLLMKRISRFVTAHELLFLVENIYADSFSNLVWTSTVEKGEC